MPHRFPRAPWPARMRWPSALATDLFAAQATRSPDSCAILFEDREWSYGEIDRVSTRIAAGLREAGVGPDRVVAIDIPRSPRQIIAILAVLKAGGAYLPLDESRSALRTQLLVGAGGARFLLADGEAGPIHTDRAVTQLDFEDLDHGSRADLQVAAWCDPDNLAYVICTSGSTGEPKAVGIPHRALVNQIFWRRAAFGLSGRDRMLYNAPSAADVAVGEVVNPLCSGGCVVICRAGAESDADYVVRLLIEARVTIAYFVSSALEPVLDAGLLRSCGDLRILNAGAEPLLAAIRDRVVSQRPGLLWHTYGPTECAITTLASRCGYDIEVTLDHACTNVDAFILDSNGDSVRPGEVGELHLAGPALARGYMGDPERTADHFRPSPRGKGRAYRTGDLVRARADGRLVFTGRRDNLVKVAGRGVMLEEVESVLRAHPRVRAASLVATLTQAGDSVLHAFVVLNPSTDERLVQSFVAERLPAHGLPSTYHSLPALPLLSGGKVDRRSLGRMAGAFRGVTNALDNVEGQLAEMWSELLGIAEVDVNRDLAQYGFNSLMLMRARSRLKKRYGVEVGLRELIDAGTVCEQAKLLVSLRDAIR